MKNYLLIAVVSVVAASFLAAQEKDPAKLDPENYMNLGQLLVANDLFAVSKFCDHGYDAVEHNNILFFYKTVVIGLRIDSPISLERYQNLPLFLLDKNIITSDNPYRDPISYTAPGYYMLLVKSLDPNSPKVQAARKVDLYYTPFNVYNILPDRTVSIPGWEYALFPTFTVVEYLKIIHSRTPLPNKADAERPYTYEDVAKMYFQYMERVYGTVDPKVPYSLIVKLIKILDNEPEVAKAALNNLLKDPNPRLAEAARSLLSEPKLPRWKFYGPEELPKREWTYEQIERETEEERVYWLKTPHAKKEWLEMDVKYKRDAEKAAKEKAEKTQPPGKQ
jgi:hypothetical protein